jgi:hypothetical protein
LVTSARRRIGSRPTESAMPHAGAGAVAQPAKHGHLHRPPATTRTRSPHAETAGRNPHRVLLSRAVATTGPHRAAQLDLLSHPGPAIGHVLAVLVGEPKAEDGDSAVDDH